MKKIFWYLFFAIVILQGCSKDDEDLNLTSSDKLNFPLHIEKFGKAVASEIHQTVKNLNEKGVNYSNANKTREFRNHFFEDWFQANPKVKMTKTNINEILGNDQTFTDGLRNLTKIQLKFIDRILNACALTISYDDFADRLSSINKDIYEQVPKIEQERLLYITSVLYFGIGEIKNLEEQGQMLISPQNKFQIARIKTRSEEEGGFWGTCREIFSAVAIGVIGELTQLGEMIVSVSEVVMGGVVMIMTVVCVSDTDPKPLCTKKYTECMSTDNKYSKPNSNGWGDTLCAACLRACIGNGGIWNCI